jgi:hypothetical protein
MGKNLAKEVTDQTVKAINHKRKKSMKTLHDERTSHVHGLVEVIL